MPRLSNGAHHETAQCLPNGGSDLKADNGFEDPTMNKTSYTQNQKHALQSTNNPILCPSSKTVNIQ